MSEAATVRTPQKTREKLVVVDSDTHIDETEDTWTYVEPHERELAPVGAAPKQIDPSRPATRYWVIDGKRHLRFIRDDKRTGTNVEARELLDVNARLRAMDELGVDIHIIYPTLFLMAITDNPAADRAARRSYNRWLADRCQKSGGRLRWILMPPLMDMKETIEELRFGAANGACGILKKGDREAGHWVDDEYFFPMYEEAQRLNLPICFHTGSGTIDSTPAKNFTSSRLIRIGMPPQHAFHSLVFHNVPQKFPEVRWGFIEAGASWVPAALYNLGRTLKKRYHIESGPFTFSKYSVEGNVLAQNKLYVSCMVDEDLPYLVQTMGEDHMLTGSDYSHGDPAIELDFQVELQSRADRGEITQSLVRKIISDNPRRFYGLD